MAKIEVGSQLKWQGHPVICTSIETRSETCLARVNSVIMRLELNSLANVKLLTQEWDDFEENDIITFDFQKLQLTELSKNLFFVYTYFKAKKENLDGPTAAEASNREASGSQTEANRRGDQSGGGSGEQSLSEDCNSQNRDGQSRGSGIDSNSEVCQEGEHTTTNDGSSANSRPGSSVQVVRREETESQPGKTLSFVERYLQAHNLRGRHGDVS